MFVYVLKRLVNVAYDRKSLFGLSIFSISFEEYQPVCMFCAMLELNNRRFLFIFKQRKKQMKTEKQSKSKVIFKLTKTAILENKEQKKLSINQQTTHL